MTETKEKSAQARMVDRKVEEVKVEEVEAKWWRLVKELEAIRARGEHCVLTGDLNKLVGDDALGVPGNSPEVSPGGRLLRGLLATGNWLLVNGMGEEVVQGGPSTREEPRHRGALLPRHVCCVTRAAATREQALD